MGNVRRGGALERAISLNTPPNRRQGDAGRRFLREVQSQEDDVIPSRSLPLLLVPMLALGACANVPMAPPQADQEAKRFDRPSPDKGALYIYRPGWMGLAKPVDVAVAGGATAQLGSNTYIRLEGPPGPVEIGCRVGDNNANRQVEIQDGQTRYVEVSMKIGLWLPGCEIAEVPPDQGQAAVLASQRVAPQ